MKWEIFSHVYDEERFSYEAVASKYFADGRFFFTYVTAITLPTRWPSGIVTRSLQDAALGDPGSNPGSR